MKTKNKPLYFGAALILLGLLPMPANGQDCDCDYTISLNASEWFFDGIVKGVQPGQTICFASGTRTGIELRNIHGTPGNPVIIKNKCDGKVTISSPSHYGNSFTVTNCSNIHLTGANNPNEAYGIEITGAVMGINFLGRTTDVEADHLYVHNVGCVGVVAKTDPTCDSVTWRGNFTLRNASFHHNKITDTGCEGFYIGNSHYDAGVTKTCGGVPTLIYEHDLDSIQVYNNLLTNIGNDGIQIGGATNAFVHHNTISTFGTNGTSQHKNGIQCGNGTTQAKVYNNVVENGGYCFFDYGGGGVWFNNIGRNCSEGGFIVNDVPPNLAPTGFVIVNNTLVDCMKTGLMIFSQNTNPSVVANNIFAVASHTGYAHVKYNSSSLQAYWTDSNNLKTNTIGTVLFADVTANDFHLLAGSPAVDGGLDMTSQGVTFDLDETARPSGNAFDIGAYELFINTPPIADAGPDTVVTLPDTTATLYGDGSDVDGPIASFSWTQVSGNTATLSGDSTPTLSVSGLTSGTYVFRLTVTDSNSEESFDDAIVIVNAPPVPDAGPDQVIMLPVTTAMLAGSAADMDGTIVSLEWSVVSGNSPVLSDPNNDTLNISGLAIGTYVLRLTATDNLGATGTDEVTVILEYAHEAKFNFAHVDQAISGWNTLGGHPHAALREVQDLNSNIRVNSVSTAQWNPVYYGMWTTAYNGGATNGTIQPAAVVQTNWFNYNSPYGSVVNGVLQGDNVQVLDLIPNQEYELSLGASRITGGATGIMEYRFNGVDPHNFDVTDNATNQVTVNVTSDANGRIGISARKISGSSLNFGYIGWLVVTKITTGGGGARMNTRSTLPQSYEERIADKWATLFPNPVHDELTVEVNQGEAGIITIGLKDTSGKTVLVEQTFAAKGITRIILNELRKKGIHSGLYVVDVANSTDRASFKVIVR